MVACAFNDSHTGAARASGEFPRNA